MVCQQDAAKAAGAVSTASYRYVGDRLRSGSGPVALGRDRVGVVQSDEERLELRVGRLAQLGLELGLDLRHGAPDGPSKCFAARREVHALGPLVIGIIAPLQVA